MATQKTASPAKKSQGFQGIRAAFWVIVCCFIIAVCFFKFYLGNPSHFQGGDNEGHPLDIWGQSTKVVSWFLLFKPCC